MPGFIVIILIGAIIGFIARFLYPGPNTPHGFILTTVLGVVGASLATFFYRFIGLIDSNRLADPFSMIAGALIVLFIWNRLAVYGLVTDPGIHHKRASAAKGGAPPTD